MESRRGKGGHGESPVTRRTGPRRRSVEGDESIGVEYPGVVGVGSGKLRSEEGVFGRKPKYGDTEEIRVES